MGVGMDIRRVITMGVLLATSATANANSTSNREYLTEDFFIEVVKEKTDLNFFSHQQPTDCRAKIHTIMCLVDPAEDGQYPTKRTSPN